MYRSAVLRAGIVLAVLVGLMLTAFGCGSSGPSAAVEGFIKATQDKNCSKMVDYMDLKSFEASGVTVGKDELVKACEEQKDQSELLSYKIIEEKTDGDKSEVKVEVTTKDNGEEKTESDTLTVNKQDGEWKVSLL